MKKSVTLILVIIGISGVAGTKPIRTNVEVIKRFENKTWANLKCYTDSTLLENVQAYLYATKIEVPRFKAFPYLAKTEIAADSIVLHGLRTIFIGGGYYKQEVYNDGALKSEHFFNQSGKEITKHEFEQYNPNYTLRCGNIIGQYLVK